MSASERIYRSRAVVMRRMDLGEADRVLTLFTHKHGKVKAIAKGVRKPGSRKAGHVELFMLVDVLVSRGRSLDILTQAEMIEAYRPLREELVRMTYASHCVELVDAFTEEADPNPQLFDLLAAGLLWLATTDDLRRTTRFIELALLEFAGFRPDFFNCVICAKEITARDHYYSVRSGGVVCPACTPGQSHLHPLPLRTLKFLRFMQTRSYDTVSGVSISEPVHRESERLLLATLAFHLERRLKSVTFLERLRREDRGKQDASEEAGV